MLKIKIKDGQKFRDIISKISNLINEARFTIDKEGMHLLAMDPANVAMIDFNVYPESMEIFEHGEREDFAVNISNFKQVLKAVHKEQPISLEKQQDKDICRLKVTIHNTNDDEFFLPIIDLEEREQKKPSLSYKAAVMINSQELQNKLLAADIVGESVGFVMEDGIFRMQSEGDLNKFNVDIKKNIQTLRSEPAKCRYSLEYLKHFAQSTAFCEFVEVRFQTDYPASFIYREEGKYYLEFIIAPRVEND